MRRRRRSIYSSPSILVLDEPLAALGIREGGQVLGLIQGLRRQRKVSVVLIVHNYNQIFEVCDRINFLHSGEIVLDAETSRTSEEELIRIVKSGLGRAATTAAAVRARPVDRTRALRVYKRVVRAASEEVPYPTPASSGRLSGTRVDISNIDHTGIDLLRR